MFDSINFNANINEVMYEYYANNMTDVKRRGKSYCEGTLFGMTARIGYSTYTRTYFLNVSASLPKLIQGCNGYAVSLEQILEWYNEKCQQIPDLQHASVTRIDIAGTALVDHPVGNYLACLQSLPGFKKVREYSARSRIDFEDTDDDFELETKLYIQKRMSLSFYNKRLELVDSGTGDPLPADSQVHLLRYELQLKKDLRRRLKLEEGTALTMDVLLSEDMLLKLEKLWYGKYLAVRKIERLDILATVSSTREITECLVAIGIHAVGILETEAFVHSLKDNGTIKGNSGNALLRRLKKWEMKHFSGGPVALVAEMDDRFGFIHDSYVMAIHRFCKAHPSIPGPSTYASEAREIPESFGTMDEAEMEKLLAQSSTPEDGQEPSPAFLPEAVVPAASRAPALAGTKAGDAILETFVRKPKPRLKGGRE